MTVIYKNDDNTEIYIRITSKTIEVLTPEEAKISLNTKKYNDKNTIYEHYIYFIEIQNKPTNSKKALLVALNNLIGNTNLSM